MSKERERFYTVRGYELLSKDANLLTPSMEDYLEMVYRLSRDKGYTRISDLASALNVQPLPLPIWYRNYQKPPI